MTPRWMHHLFTTAAIIGIFGWGFLIVIWMWWTLQPTVLPRVTEPMPVLNENNEVGVGDTLLVQLSITKLKEQTPIDSSRYISCASGNLITLTAAPTKLPVGSYEVISDDVIIPERLSVGDTCTFEITIVYEINPIRTESVTFKSELFTIVDGEKA